MRNVKNVWLSLPVPISLSVTAGAASPGRVANPPVRDAVSGQRKRIITSLGWGQPVAKPAFFFFFFNLFFLWISLLF